jgi:hypothetical protein
MVSPYEIRRAKRARKRVTLPYPSPRPPLPYQRDGLSINYTARDKYLVRRFGKPFLDALEAYCDESSEITRIIRSTSPVPKSSAKRTAYALMDGLQRKMLVLQKRWSPLTLYRGVDLDSVPRVGDQLKWTISGWSLRPSTAMSFSTVCLYRLHLPAGHRYLDTGTTEQEILLIHLTLRVTSVQHAAVRTDTDVVNDRKGAARSLIDVGLSRFIDEHNG